LFEKRGLEIAGSEEFTGWTMTQFDSMASEEIGSRLSRLPLVLLLTVGLLFSLLHCAGCGFDFATANTPTISTNLDHGFVPDTPEQQLPCHSGHCLSNVTAQQLTVAGTPEDLVGRLLVSGREQFRAALADLPPFKPPRA
jgi:hypothetical protein